ncbi:MAG: NUDIX hydrolase [Patescibacteria group bacterium]
MDPIVSYSAGVAYIKFGKNEPQLLLVLQKPGEKNAQKTGGVFVEEKVWKMPMGHFNPQKDSDLVATAHREFEEEAGLTFDKELIDPELSVSIRISSERPGAQFHEDKFFLVVAQDEPKSAPGKERDEAIEKAKFFPLNGLPNGKTKSSEGASLSWGHRKKLTKLLAACEENPKGKEIVDSILKSLMGKQ